MLFGVNSAASAAAALEDLNKADIKPSEAYDFGLKVAEAEGVLHMFVVAEDAEERMVEKGLSENNRLFGLMSLMLRELESGADDTWSGRGNDRNRARFDGKREAAKSIRYSIEARFKNL